MQCLCISQHKGSLDVALFSQRVYLHASCHSPFGHATNRGNYLFNIFMSKSIVFRMITTVSLTILSEMV